MSKVLAGREKDVDFVRAMLRAGVVSEAAVRSLETELNPEQAARFDAQLAICLRST